MRLILKVLVGVVLLLFLAGIVTLIIFNTSVGKNWIGKEVKARTGIEMTYARFYPRSFKSFKVTGVEAYEEKRMTLSQVEVEVNLLESLRRRSPVIKEVELLRPQIKVEAETLISVLKNAAKKEKPLPPPTPQKPPPAAPQNPPPTPDKKVPAQKPTPETAEKPSPPQKSPPKPTQKPPQKPPPKPQEPARKVTPPPAPRITVTEGAAELTYKAFPGKKVLLSGISFQTSPEKENREGILSLKDLHLPGLEVPLGLEIPVKIQGRQLTLPPQQHSVKGVTLLLSGGVVGRAPFPFKIQGKAEIPETLNYTPSRIPKLEARVQSGDLSFLAQGSLRSPRSIQCDLLGKTGEVALSFQGRGEKTFDSQKVSATLRNGQLTIPSYQLRSNDLSLMGNGIFTLSQKGNAVLRMVGNKNWERQYWFLTNGLRLGRPAVTMYELDTPDRYYKDFFLRVSPEKGVEYQFQNQEKWFPIEMLTSRFKDFTVRELAEE